MCNSFITAIEIILLLAIGLSGWLAGTRPFIEAHGDKSEVNFAMWGFQFILDLFKAPYFAKRSGANLPVGYWAHLLMIPCIVVVVTITASSCGSADHAVRNSTDGKEYFGVILSFQPLELSNVSG